MNHGKTSLCILLILLLFSFNLVIAAEIAPDFTLTDIDGNEFTLSNHRGKVVLLQFFATWCNYCIKEMPELKAVLENFGESLVIISVTVDPDRDVVQLLEQFKEKYEIPWIIARDTLGVSDTYQVIGLPKIVIIDQNGYVRYQHIGFTEESTLSEETNELIKKPPPTDGTVGVQEAPVLGIFQYAAAGIAIMIVAAIVVYLARATKHKPT